MNKILAFGASNSRKSINKQLAFFAAGLMKDVEVTRLDLSDYEMPLYGIDREREKGIPLKAIEFRKLLEGHDGIIISFAEHNGAYSAVFKNLFDWISRIKGSTWQEKPMLLMATSPGARGGTSVLQIAAKRFPWNGGKVVGTFSLPHFNDNFDPEKGITDPDLLNQLKENLSKLSEEIALISSEVA